MSVPRLYNTMSRRKEELRTLEPGKVRMYVCGVTVYSDAHIGHAMSALVFDVIRRYLLYRGYQVRFVMNFTDVDDKIIARANRMGIEPSKLAEGLVEAYRRNLKDLNVLPADSTPRVTRSMDAIQELVRGLVDRGHAYAPGNGDVYFRVSKDEDYGRLSGRRLEDMRAGSRIEVGELKEHPMDFALWKAAKPGEPAWESPWGRGRPGWHIECSAMSLAELGDEIDIHGGGNDLIFPHHENEIAQSESYTGKPFARYWMHNGMLQLAGEKMSKSLGNLVSIDEFLKAHDPDVMRMLVLNGSYRAPLTYSEEIAAAADKGLERLRSGLRPASEVTRSRAPEDASALDEQATETRRAFVEAMDDDFATPSALGHLFGLVRAINAARDDGASGAELAPAQAALRELMDVLGLRPAAAATRDSDKFIALLLEVRAEMRRLKQWAVADMIRDRLKELGVSLEDGKDGTTRYR